MTALADRANRYIAEREPWKHVKNPERRVEVHGVCSLGINVFRALVIYLKPILPAMAAKAEAFLQVEPLAVGRRRNALARPRDHALQSGVHAHRCKGGGSRSGRYARRTRRGIQRGGRRDDQHRRLPEGGSAGRPRGVRRAGRWCGQTARTHAGHGRSPVRRVFSGIRSAYDPAQLVGRLTVWWLPTSRRAKCASASRRHGAGSRARRQRHLPRRARRRRQAWNASNVGNGGPGCSSSFPQRSSTTSSSCSFWACARSSASPAGSRPSCR